MQLIVPANKQGAGFMAAGYARASGKVGVFIVTSGPAATNSVTPIRDSMADSVPVVLICGQVARSAIGSDAFQEAPVFNVMSPCAKHVFLVEEPEDLEATVRTAFGIARSGRPGSIAVRWSSLKRGSGGSGVAAIISPQTWRLRWGAPVSGGFRFKASLTRFLADSDADENRGNLACGQFPDTRGIRASPWQNSEIRRSV